LREPKGGSNVGRGGELKREGARVGMEDNEEGKDVG